MDQNRPADGAQSVSIGIWIMLGVQALLALALLAFGLSMRDPAAPERSTATMDIIVLTAPLILIVLGGAGAYLLARSGRKGLAWLSALAPLPLALALFIALGLVL